MTSALPPSAPPPAAEPPGAPPPPSSWPAPPPSGPTPRGQLRRSRDDRVIGGVAGGLAEYTGIDALLWRVGAIALTVVAGSGVVVYALLWLLMPSAPAGPPGVAVEKPPRAPRSPVPGVTLAVLLIVLGVVTLVDQLTDADLGPRGYLGSALLVVGIGLVVGAVTGVGRGAKTGLVTLGVLLTAALALASTVQLPSGDVGDRTYRPLTADAVQPRYEIGLGDLTVDLRDVDLSGLSAPIEIMIESGVGDVDVLVPASADVEVSVDNGIGEAEVFGQDRSSGGTFPGTGRAAWTGDEDPEFVLTIESGLGDVEVSRG
ncbi:PspC domain-containing protein [Modestobacter sp. SSW1-42]|uniref:PspC domain-containing protein n=1 Tax=Modestobacter sp. SSW1-42 TaxID=596372 RepID=UPI003987CED8